MFGLPVFALFLFFAAQDASQQAGMQALDRSDYKTAVDIFSKLTVSDPRDYAAFFNLALAESFLHQDESAATHLRQTLSLKPRLYEAELNLGMLLLRNNKAVEAAPLLKDAASQKPAEVRPIRYLGDALLAQSDFAGAAAAYEAALKVSPQLAVAELGWGQSLRQLGRLDEALPHYQNAAQIDSSLQSYLPELAGAFAANNRPADAIALLKQVPSQPAIQEELGRLYLANGQADQAVPCFQAAVAQSPTAANQVALATAYLKNNQQDLAIPILERALAGSPGDYDLRMVVGRLRRDRHDYRNAADLFVAAAAIKPDAVEAWNEAASAFVLSEQYPQAIAALDKLHGLNAESAGNFYYRAISLDKLHQKKPAIVSYQRFLELAGGKFPDQEFNARQRCKTLEHEVNR